MDDPLALENQVCYSLALASRGVIAAYRAALEPLGLTHPQYLVMLAMWERRPRSGRDLAEALRLDPGTLSPLVKRLERDGYLTRSRRAGDERTLDIDLTNAGVALRDRAVNVPGIMVRRLQLEGVDLAALRETLDRLTAAAAAPLELSAVERSALAAEG